MSLRDFLLASGVALLLTALLLTAGGWPFAIPLAVIGAAAVLGILFERSVYKTVDEGRPGPQWQASAERFIDPASGEAVTVFVKPATGERRYVRSITKR